jgi:hypothetical protein
MSVFGSVNPYYGVRKMIVYQIPENKNSQSSPFPHNFPIDCNQPIAQLEALGKSCGEVL